MKANLIIARFPGNHSEHPESTDLYVDLVRRAERDHRVGQVYFWKLSDTPITMSRNRAVKDALDLGVDFLFMLDADMGLIEGQKSFYDTAMDFVFRRQDPALIAAPYCGPAPHSVPYVFKWVNHLNKDLNGNPDFRLTKFDREEVVNRSGMEEVAALPTGLMLLDMRLFTGFRSPLTGQVTKLAPPWFEYEWTDAYRTEKASTEDVYFSRNASLIGCKNFCAWDCWVRHWKLAPIDKPTLLTSDDVSREFKEAMGRASSTLLFLNNGSIPSAK